MVSFLDAKNFFYKHQYGFRANYTSIACTERDNKNFATGLFLYLSKAFDWVHLKTLFKKNSLTQKYEVSLWPCLSLI